MREPAGLQLAIVAPLTQSGRVENGPRAMVDDDMLHRLAIWLADVSAEAALAPVVSVAPPKGPSLAGSPP
jgi:hypothetical protein